MEAKQAQKLQQELLDDGYSPESASTITNTVRLEGRVMKFWDKNTKKICNKYIGREL